MSGVKYDGGKPRWELLDMEALDEVAKVLTVGAYKYGDHNWRGGLEVSRTMGAAYRHMRDVMASKDIDEETGLHHLAHAICELMFTYWTLKNWPELDDRYGDSEDVNGA